MARTQSKLTLNCTCYSTFDHNLRSHMFCEILFYYVYSFFVILLNRRKLLLLTLYLLGVTITEFLFTISTQYHADKQ